MSVQAGDRVGWRSFYGGISLAPEWHFGTVVTVGQAPSYGVELAAIIPDDLPHYTCSPILRTVSVLFPEEDVRALDALTRLGGG